VVEQVERDLEILPNLAAVAGGRWALADEYDLLGLVQEFAQPLRAELDFVQEGRNAERFAQAFAADPALHAPRTFWDTTTSRVLTLERIHGITIDDLAALGAADIDRSGLAVQAARVILEMGFGHGFVHADFHAGDFFVASDGRLGLVDFSMVGTVDART
jgi:ubiquinone biosynthesis protein